MVKNVLWAGGWDSTFRVLDLVLNKRMTVQPYYIIDENRLSTNMELKTMDRITHMMEEMDESASDRIKQRIEIWKKDIPENTEITETYHRLAKQSHLGGQNDWLPRYAHSIGLHDLNLSAHADDTIESFIKKDIEMVDTGDDKYFKIKNIPSDKDLGIFSYFHFPLLHMSKLDMQKEAISSGFNHIMEETWFCHSPINGKPCGMCVPCQTTRKEGLRKRVPDPTVMMKITHILKKVKRRLK